MNRAMRRIFRWFRGRDKGTVAVTFALSLPILLLVIGVIVQYAMLANARLTVDRAMASAARSAMTSLPINPNLEVGGPWMVRRSALMVLASLSPVSQEGATSDATEVAQALTDAGMTLPDRYDLRYAFADKATTLDITVPVVNPGDSALDWTVLVRRHAPSVTLTMTYKFRLTVPGANILGTRETVAGVEGYYVTLKSEKVVYLSDGREALSTVNEPWSGTR